MRKPASMDVKPKVADGRKYLRPDEANRLIDAAGERGRYGFRDKALLRLTYRHGLRASEACEMRWEQIDLEHGTILVERLKRGKTASHSMDRDELRDLRKLRKVNTGAYVFETERGGPMGRDTLAYIVREAGKAAGLGDHLHPHMLRHAAGYSMVNQGVDLRLIQDFLGHRSPQMTMLYTEVSPKRLAAVRVR